MDYVDEGETLCALKDIDFQASDGEFVSFVGPSGSGKSSVMGLLQRFYDVELGRITVAGEDLKGFDVRWWRGERP